MGSPTRRVARHGRRVVGDGEVGEHGVAPAEAAGSQVGRRRLPDQRPARGDVVGRQQRADVEHVAGLPEPRVAVGLRELGRLEDEVRADLRRRVELGVVVPVEHRQRGEQRRPLAPGGRLGDARTAELADRGVGHPRPVPGGVRDGQHAGVVGARGVAVRGADRRGRRLGDEALGPHGAHGVDARGAVGSLRRADEAGEGVAPTPGCAGPRPGAAAGPSGSHRAAEVGQCSRKRSATAPIVLATRGTAGTPPRA